MSFEAARVILIVFQSYSILVHILIIYLVMRYRKVFYNSHYFYKAAIQLALIDISGLILNICYLTCLQYHLLCYRIVTRWIPYFMTQGMLVLIAFNRFTAVIFHSRYRSIFNTKYSSWLFVIPITVFPETNLLHMDF